jgi:rhodanese-related sulfurtransferase
MAHDLCSRHELSVIDMETLGRFRDDESRTTYVFDVRQADAFERGHVPGGVHAPGGQLVQATDSYAAVRNARVVVVDEHMVQSVMTAHWLAQMGWDVHVLAGAGDHFAEAGPAAVTPLATGTAVAPRVSADELAGWIDRGSCAVVDVGESYWYREGRIPGSHYSMRTHLASALTKFRYDERIVFCCSDGRFSPFAAADAVRMGFDHVHVLDGGRAAWRRAGHPVERIGEDTDELVLSETDDMWYPPWARKEGVNEAIMQYLTWETGLLEPVSKETYVRFSVKR